MRWLSVAVLLLVVACAPALTPVISRSNGEVDVVLSAARSVYDVQVVVLNASSDDFRCVAFESDLVCSVGSISARKEVSFTVVGEPGMVSCVAYGFTRVDLSMASYRPFACVVR